LSEFIKKEKRLNFRPAVYLYMHKKITAAIMLISRKAISLTELTKEGENGK
jgi:hypothetical protein